MRMQGLRCFVDVLMVMASVNAACGQLLDAQVDDGLPRIQLATREALVEALRGDPDPMESGLRLALIAAQGREIIPRLHALVTDETEDGVVRLNALRVLGFMLDSSSVGIVLEYASSAGPLREWAQATLQMFPYTEACEHWRAILRDPALHHSGSASYALSGIRYCGNEADIAIVEGFVARGVSRGTREYAAFAIARLRMTMAERYRNTEFEGNYPPTGDYRPPPALAAKIRQQLCGGPCAAGLVVQASAVTKLRGY